jgi:uncharacterized protein (DUF58 family)
MAGVYFDQDDIFKLESEVRHWLNTPARSNNMRSGFIKSRRLGRGLDFAELRIYQPGDDVRHIDWRVSARTGNTHCKVFSEEKERPVIIVIDQSQNMFFGSTVRFKSTQAANIGSILAWSSFIRGDKVGGLLIGANGAQPWRPLKKKSHFLHFLNAISEQNNQLSAHSNVKNHWKHNFEELLALGIKGSDIYFISDFSQWTEKDQQHLGMLGQHNRILGVQVVDKVESKLPHFLPKLGNIVLSDGQQKVHNSQINPWYQEKITQTWQDTHNSWQKDGHFFCQIKAQDNAMDKLEEFNLLTKR